MTTAIQEEIFLEMGVGEFYVNSRFTSHALLEASCSLELINCANEVGLLVLCYFFENRVLS